MQNLCWDTVNNFCVSLWGDGGLGKNYPWVQLSIPATYATVSTVQIVLKNLIEYKQTPKGKVKSRLSVIKRYFKGGGLHWRIKMLTFLEPRLISVHNWPKQLSKDDKTINMRLYMLFWMQSKHTRTEHYLFNHLEQL